jgi:CO dehydrogenase/acetyl-CoA synthase beta subunit
LGQVVLVSGRFDDEYGHLLDLQAAIHSVLLKGVTCRSMPDSARFWYRVSYDALHQGVSLAHVGNAIVASLMDLEGIEGVTVLLITSDEQLAPLKGLSTQANRIAASLIKRNEETEHECDACDFSDICLEGAS